jgi:hypothetical protein
MSVHNLIDSIVAYIEELKTDYAILINGQWGCGKTFFITHDLFTSLKDKYPKMRCVHISLNGLENLDEIYQKIVVELLSTQELARVGFGLLKTLLELDIEIPKIGLKSKNIINVLKNTSLVIAKESNVTPDMLLCFDDLERISGKTTIEGVLGYIYANFIERKHMKVLLISDESKIESSVYTHGKEKIIGRTFLFTPSIQAIFSHLLNEIVSDAKSREQIETEKEFLLTLFKDYKITNLRTVQFIMRALAVISASAPMIKAETFHNITFFTAILSFEYRKGALDLEKAYKLKDINNIELLKSLRKKSAQEEPSYEETFYDVYIRPHRNEYDFFSSIVDMIFSGLLDKELFLSDVKSLEPDNLSPEQLSKQKIFQFRELQDEDFQNTVKEVYNYMLKGAYGITAFLQLSLHLTYFYDKGIITEDPKTILQKASRIVVDRMQDDDINTYLQFGRIQIRSDSASPTYQAIRTSIDKAIADSKNAEKTSSIKTFFTTLLKGDNNAWRLYNNIESELIFLFVDLKDLASSILSASSDGVASFSAIFEHRYLRISNARDIYNKEIPALSTLLNIIKEGATDLNDKPLRKFIINELIENIVKVIEHLNIEVSSDAPQPKR